MDAVSVDLEDVSLNIPVFMPGQQRLIRKSALVSKIGGRIDTSRGNVCVEALRHVTFSLKERENLALIGHNGAGKSTLLKVIADIYPVSSGTVAVKGQIGCLLSMGLGMTDDMTGLECVKHQCVIIQQHLGDWRDVAEDIAEFTELGPYMNMPIRTYSNGMRARLAAALATAWQKDILLVDEGIGAGDAAFHEKFQARVTRFMEQARLLIAASHSTELLRRYCRTGLVMEHGNITFHGDLDEALEFYKESQAAAAIQAPQPHNSIIS